MSLEPDLKPDKRIDEYVLIERLSSYSHVWHAFDEGAQREVVLKFVADAISASREGTILADIDHPNILKLLRKFAHEGIHVLVFEYVPGVRLDKAIREGVSRENGFTICLNICSALAEIHTYGLFHGDLSPFNVIWSADKGKAFLIDFGAMGGCTVLSATPEHDPESGLSIGPHTDIVGLGRIILLLLPHMKSLYERCMYDDIALRPTSVQVHAQLKKARNRRHFVIRGAASIFLVGLIIAASLYFREPSKEDRIHRIKSQSPSVETVAALHRKLQDPQYENFRGLLVRTIAAHNQAIGKEPIIVDDLSNYIAVFAVKTNPMILLEEGRLLLGDPAVIGGEAGYILEINRGSVILMTANGSKEIRYEKPVLFGRQSQTFKPINISPGRQNFFLIIGTIAEVSGYTVHRESQLDGYLSGSWPQESYRAFLENLVGQLTVDQYNIHVRETAVPRSVISGESFWILSRITLSELLSQYEPYIGYPCRYEGDSDPADLLYPVMQFHDLVAVLELTIEVVDNTIIVREGNSP